MRHIVFEEADSYKVALLVKASAFNSVAIKNNYVDTLQAEGIPLNTLVAFDLPYNEHGKAPAGMIKEYLGKLLKALEGIGVNTCYVTDTNYFKVLTKKTKAEGSIGYTFPCAIKGYEHMTIILGVNYQSLIFNPDLKSDLNLSLATLVSHTTGTYTPLGQDVIHSSYYPNTPEKIKEALQSLHQYDQLYVDIEAFSLRFWEAGIASIAFAWDSHNGLAFLCDITAETLDDGYQVSVAERRDNPVVRALIKDFLTTYKGKIYWHFAGYDVKVLIYTLWMKDALDYAGLLEGLHIMYSKSHCTKLIAYLATNSTAGNVLGLKSLAHEHAGNWAVEEINDVLSIPTHDLLRYNLVDTLSTAFVHEKYWPILAQDNQEEFYHKMAIPSQKVITQMELVGMPMSWEMIRKAETSLEAMVTTALQTIMQNPWIGHTTLDIQQEACDAANAKLKTKQHPISKFADITFNPGSNKHMQKLLYVHMQLPVLDYTDTKQPAVGAETLEKLVNHCKTEEDKELLKAFVTYAKAQKILGTFISAFKEGLVKTDGMIYLHGTFMFGGTVSGRLSSKEPNLQNLPSNSSLAKYVKQCFTAPQGWLFGGADFSALEDRVNTVLTKDPNKVKVYAEGYDSHSLRAYAYFGDQMPDIENTVASINSIAVKGSPYYHLRQDSKSPTFALTFAGTWRTLVKNLGWSEEKAKKVEENYNSLYQISIQWVQERIKEASKVGYAEAAFGLRIRTPLLGQTIVGKGIRESEAEARTLGNAISGQSYGLLTNRAINAFMEKVWASPYATSIMPTALIHDAIYLLFRNDVRVVKFVNDNLIKEMQWQELPEIQHPEVKLGAELDIFWPSWANPITLPNGLSEVEITEACAKGKHKYENKS